MLYTHYSVTRLPKLVPSVTVVLARFTAHDHLNDFKANYNTFKTYGVDIRVLGYN